MNKKESNKFPAVMITGPCLGLEEGTVLVFDGASGKYVSIEEDEELADDYYYSGYAVAIDPYIIKDSIGKDGSPFTFIEPEEVVYSDKDAENQLKTKEELKKEIEHIVTKEDVKLNPGEDIKEGDKVGIPEGTIYPEYTKVHALVVDCAACGHRSLVNTVQAPGINITIMAEDENSGIQLSCSECGAALKFWFAPDMNPIDEPTKEKSK